MPTKPTRSEEIRAGATQALVSQNVPAGRIAEKVGRHMEGLKAIQRGEQMGYRMMLFAMAMVALLATLERLTPWVLVFFAVPLVWGAAQAARGAVLLSSDVLKHMDERTLRQLSWFQRLVVQLVKAAKGIKG